MQYLGGMHPKVIITLICLALLQPIAALSQTRAQKIDEIMMTYVNQHKFNGSVLVARKGQVVLKKSYGLANREWNIPNTPATKFRVGSLTKQFTAMLIMQLKQAGKLELQAPLSAYLPWYRKDIGDKVTIHHLLTHTSGIPNFTARPDFSTFSKLKFATRKFVEKYCSDTLEFKPGTKYNYNNSAYYILGAVIEEITGKPYAQVLKEQILDVIGMKNSGVDDPAEIVPGRATGYDYDYGTYSNSDYIDMRSSVLSAGAMYSTVEDLLLWDRALYTEKLISKKNRDTMFTPFLQRYAYGLIYAKRKVPGMKDSSTFVVHAGGINGFRAYIFRTLETEDVTILLCNHGLKGEVGEISNPIFAVMNGLKYELPKPSLVDEMADKLLKRNVTEAIAHYKHLKMTTKNVYDNNNRERELNALGYYLLSRKRTKDALEIFKLNTEEFPQGYNTFDSYAEALASDGQTSAAIENYKRSLELNPDNQHATQQIKELSGQQDSANKSPGK